MTHKEGPIIIIDDDPDDQEILDQVLEKLNVKNKRIMFSRCEEAYEHLETSTDQAFLIICDINLPGMTGLQLKKKIDEHPIIKRKSIPFIFLSTSCDKLEIEEAYDKLTVQGFLKKSSNLKEMEDMLTTVIKYWTICLHPNS